MFPVSIPFILQHLVIDHISVFMNALNETLSPNYSVFLFYFTTSGRLVLKNAVIFMNNIWYAEFIASIHSFYCFSCLALFMFPNTLNFHSAVWLKPMKTFDEAFDIFVINSALPLREDRLLVWRQQKLPLKCPNSPNFNRLDYNWSNYYTRQDLPKKRKDNGNYGYCPDSHSLFMWSAYPCSRVYLQPHIIEGHTYLQ